MQETTNLAARLKNQMQQENATIQDLTQKQLNAMRSELSGILRQELNTIKADIQSQSQSIGWSMFKSRFLWPTLVGLSLCLGIFGGSWATMRYFTNQITELQRNVQTLEQDGGKIQFSKCGEKRQLCAQVRPELGKFGSNGENYMILKGY